MNGALESELKNAAKPRRRNAAMPSKTIFLRKKLFMELRTL